MHPTAGQHLHQLHEGGSTKQEEIDSRSLACVHGSLRDLISFF